MKVLTPRKKVAKKAKNKLKVLSKLDLYARLKRCEEGQLCFITLSPLVEETTKLAFHPEMGIEVKVHSMFVK